MFEQESEIVDNLLTQDEKFQALHRTHSELKDKVRDAEFGKHPIDHDSLGLLKKKKLMAKDEMAAMIQEYRRQHA